MDHIPKIKGVAESSKLSLLRGIGFEIKIAVKKCFTEPTSKPNSNSQPLSVSINPSQQTQPTGIITKNNTLKREHHFYSPKQVKFKRTERKLSQSSSTESLVNVESFKSSDNAASEMLKSNLSNADNNLQVNNYLLENAVRGHEIANLNVLVQNMHTNKKSLFPYQSGEKTKASLGEFRKFVQQQHQALRLVGMENYQKALELHKQSFVINHQFLEDTGLVGVI